MTIFTNPKRGFMNTLLIEILQWMQNNNYRRASFDRLTSIIPSAATYEQLGEIINTNSDIFRSTIIKGGLPGMALLDDVSIQDVLNSLREAPAPLLYAPAIPMPTTDAGGDKVRGVYGPNDTLPATIPAAPTVTPEAIQAEIASEHYRNLGGALKQVGPTANVTLCVLVLHNGFTILGKSACVNSENFDEDLGRKLAREDAVRQLWPFLGFRLADERRAKALATAA